jgi:hypothetical protein
MSEAMTETTEAKPLGYLNYRCPHCKGDRCGTDANAGWDVVTQQSALLSEFDDQWCNDCGEVTLEEFTVTDPTEIARIDAERARLKVMAAGRLCSMPSAMRCRYCPILPVSRPKIRMSYARCWSPPSFWHKARGRR